MALRIENDVIYSSDGKKLKDIYCPLKVNQAELEKRNDGHFDCSSCERLIVNTDFVSEEHLVSLLQMAPETCIYINLANPIFEVVD